MKMAMTQEPEDNLLLEALQATKKSDNLWLNQASPRDSSFVHTFRRELYTDDSVSSGPNELFELPRYHSSSSDSKHLYANNTLCSTAGQTKNHIQWQNCKSDTGCSVSSYKINNLEAAIQLSTNGVSMTVSPTEERAALEAETSRQRSQHMINGQLQFSSSDKSGMASTGPCKSALIDANCKGLSTGGLPSPGIDSNGALLHAHALVGTGGIKKSKKRSRASRRPPTTILEADSANFRSMVQQLTGFPSSPFLSDLLPRRGSEFPGFDARSQVRPSHGLGGQNIPGIFADIPTFQSFRQPLIPKSLNNRIYGDYLYRTEAPSFRHLYNDRDPSVSFGVKPTTMGISDSSPLKDILVNHSCSMPQPQSVQYSGMASLFSGIPSSTRSTPSAESCINSTPAAREGKGSNNLKEFSVDQVSKFLFDSHEYGNGKCDLQSFPMVECSKPRKETDPKISILEFNQGVNFFPSYAIEKLVPSLGN